MHRRHPTLDEIAQATDLTTKQVQRAFSAQAMRVAFMSEPRSASGCPKGNGALVSILLCLHPATHVLRKAHRLLMFCD